MFIQTQFILLNDFAEVQFLQTTLIFCKELFFCNMAHEKCNLFLTIKKSWKCPLGTNTKTNIVDNILGRGQFRQKSITQQSQLCVRYFKIRFFTSRFPGNNLINCYMYFISMIHFNTSSLELNQSRFCDQSTLDQSFQPLAIEYQRRSLHAMKSTK